MTTTYRHPGLFIPLPQSVYFSGRWSDITGNGRSVYLAIAMHARGTGVCFASVDTLARESRVSRRTAFRLIVALEKAGLILTSRHGGGRNNTMLIHLVWEPAPHDDDLRINAGEDEKGVSQGDTLSDLKGVTQGVTLSVVNGVSQGDTLSHNQRVSNNAQRVSIGAQRVSNANTKGDTLDDTQRESEERKEERREERECAQSASASPPRVAPPSLADLEVKSSVGGDSEAGKQSNAGPLNCKGSEHTTPPSSQGAAVSEPSTPPDSRVAAVVDGRGAGDGNGNRRRPTADAPPATRSPTTKAATRSRKAVPLSDADMLRIVATPAAMSRWLSWGLAGLDATDDELATLPQSSTCWFGSSQDRAKPAPAASVPMLAGYYWVRICMAHSHAGRPLALPSVGRLVGVIKNLRATRTQDQVVAIIDTITNRWGEIQGGLGSWGSGLGLDERTLGIAQVLTAAERLMRGETLNQKPAGSAWTRPTYQPKQESTNDYDSRYI